MRGRATALVTISVAVACGGPDPAASSVPLSSSGVVLPVPGSTGAESGSSSSTTREPGSSSGAVPEDSTSTGSTGEGGATGPLQDVGSPDAGSPLPVGCKGKIDFLFMISRHVPMLTVQDQLIEAFPAFIETIETKFADFDYHIMVVDSDPYWGHSGCNKDCSNPEVCPADDYPCEMVGALPACETTLGAGTVFPAGYHASNKLCPMLGGRRYFTREQPDPAGTFACAAKIGASGFDHLGDAVAAAVSPELNGPGGCNEGFLRDDALLMVTFIERSYDYYSEGKPKLWAEALLDAKHGDPNSLVMFSIGDPSCPPIDRICDLVKYYFPHWYMADVEEPDYAPAFEVATDLMLDACAQYVPQ